MKLPDEKETSKSEVKNEIKFDYSNDNQGHSLSQYCLSAKIFFWANIALFVFVIIYSIFQ